MNISTSPTREKYPLSEKKIIKKTISSVIGSIFGLFFLSFFFIGPIIGLMQSGNFAFFSGLLGTIVYSIPVFMLVIIVLVYLYQRWYFQTYYYDSNENYLVIRKGPITPKEITIPWERIQDVYVDQDLLDRLFGLYDVHLSTATLSSGIQAHIDGVEKTAADGLREVLLGKVKSRISRPTQ